MVICAEELCEGDFARGPYDRVIQITKVNVDWELEMVTAFGLDLFSDRVVILPPFATSNHIEVFNG